MKFLSRKSIFLLVFFACLILALKWLTSNPFYQPNSSSNSKNYQRAIPVEVVPIHFGEIEQRRTFSGSLEALAEFVVAPKVSGRVEKIFLNIADPVDRGQVVAELDNDEYVQAVNQAQADLKVRQANLVEANSALEIATRELKRIQLLRQRGVASESQLDTAKAAKSAKQAALEVARAQVVRAEASLETAKIHLRYTRITADWSGGNDRRVVAERYVDDGETVSINAPLLRIVEINPITGVIFVGEKDYPHFKSDLPVTITTDAYPGESFTSKVDRIAPVFQQTTRQARVELTVDNDRLKLKPGMFIRAGVVLDRISKAAIVPEQALTRRDDGIGVFVVNDSGDSVSWKKVRVGIRENGRVQLLGNDLNGRVVTLGQELLQDGSRITIPGSEKKSFTKNGRAELK
jgi:RND family efflux transporter MFP subunit